MALKIVASQSRRPPYARLAAELGMSASEVHASVKRAAAAGLLHGIELQYRPNRTALEEFLVHGLKYTFPPQRGAVSRGVPTSYAAEPLRSLVTRSSDLEPVWPHPNGKQRGISFSPLYKAAPAAALRDRQFYEYLALADAMREGRARDRKIAERELHRRLSGAHARQKS